MRGILCSLVKNESSILRLSTGVFMVHYFLHIICKIIINTSNKCITVTQFHTPNSLASFFKILTLWMNDIIIFPLHFVLLIFLFLFVLLIINLNTLFNHGSNILEDWFQCHDHKNIEVFSNKLFHILLWCLLVLSLKRQFWRCNLLDLANHLRFIQLP